MPAELAACPDRVAAVAEGEPRVDLALIALVSAACLFFGTLLFAEVGRRIRKSML